MARAKKPASKNKRKRKTKRSDADYILSALNLSSLVPSLKPLAKRKRLKPSEKGRITRREKQLKGIPDIFPITARQAKQMKGQTLFSGVQAIQLRGVSKDAKISFKGKNLTVTEPSGRQWLYWHLSRATVRSKREFKQYGKKAFQQQFPIELVAELAAKAFQSLDVVQINLWAHAGIVGDPHHELKEFVAWVNEKWSAGRYIRTSTHGGDSDPGKWVNGIAILLEDKEYARKRAAALKKNKGVLAGLEAEGKAYRKKETARLKAKGKSANVKGKVSQKAKKAAKTNAAKASNKKTHHVKPVRKNRKTHK